MKFRNVILSISVQIVSIIVSFILNLMVPKFIPEVQYSYWQTYVLYVGYVGLTHFGLLDGIVLRYSKYNYDEINKPMIRSQFKILLISNVAMALTTIIFSLFLAEENFKYIFALVAIGMITKNIFTYTSYTFQITNRINNYAILVISQKIIYGVITISLLFFQVKNYYFYCIADLCGDIFACSLGILFNRGMYLGRTVAWKRAIKEYKINVCSGAMLLIANLSAMLLIGSAKMTVQWHWNQITFGKVSFSFSLSNLLLTFATAVSIVLFPSLKRMDSTKLPQMYLDIRNIISPILFMAMFFYFPGCKLLDMWLPQYHDSLLYLGILLPIIIYTSKVSLLTNNYLKAYRKEKVMLIVNVSSVVVAFLLFSVDAYIIDNLMILLMTVIFVIMMRSVVSEIIVMHIINIKLYKDFILEAIMTIIFISCTYFMPVQIGALVYALFLSVYLFIYRNVFKNIYSKVNCLRKIQ